MNFVPGGQPLTEVAVRREFSAPCDHTLKAVDRSQHFTASRRSRNLFWNLGSMDLVQVHVQVIERSWEQPLPDHWIVHREVKLAHQYNMTVQIKRTDNKGNFL